jgi:hypothetical protein
MRPLQPRQMPVIRRRAAITRASGGASSLLRLSGGAVRLPEGATFSQRVDRAARALRHGSIASPTVV